MNGTKDILKPTLGKVALALTFLSWQYFYSYLGIRLDFLAPIGGYITKALSAFNWSNYFVQKASLFFVWIIVAVVIFGLIWFFEVAGNTIHNAKVKKTYLNQSPDNYQHLLRENLRIMDHLRYRSVWFAALMVFFISLFSLSDLVEKLRFSILDNLSWNAFEEGATVDFYGNGFVIGSFAVFFIFWYFVAVLIVWLFEKQKEKTEEEQISDEHFAVTIEDSGAETEPKV